MLHLVSAEGLGDAVQSSPTPSSTRAFHTAGHSEDRQRHGGIEGNRRGIDWVINAHREPARSSIDASLLWAPEARHAPRAVRRSLYRRRPANERAPSCSFLAECSRSCSGESARIARICHLAAAGVLHPPAPHCPPRPPPLLTPTPANNDSHIAVRDETYDAAAISR